MLTPHYLQSSLLLRLLQHHQQPVVVRQCGLDLAVDPAALLVEEHRNALNGPGVHMAVRVGGAAVRQQQVVAALARAGCMGTHHVEIVLRVPGERWPVVQFTRR
eukprot:CAMPEP_0181337814 /NCGR_PEP_ID=MMETSP1101-20121128/28260_1 /TAXON_ID=46948 /ORGANISM="Rhodomonas abbreviata, Strain Caron Lab Isolate" /LENGTH=103 /DNA_ID=CAMNT_0023448415 /DNA_START=71 /DNA_END=378 /DNA_ORIENTATION=-